MTGQSFIDSCPLRLIYTEPHDIGTRTLPCLQSSRSLGEPHCINLVWTDLGYSVRLRNLRSTARIKGWSCCGDLIQPQHEAYLVPLRVMRSRSGPLASCRVPAGWKILRGNLSKCLPDRGCNASAMGCGGLLHLPDRSGSSSIPTGRPVPGADMSTVHSLVWASSRCITYRRMAERFRWKATANSSSMACVAASS